MQIYNWSVSLELEIWNDLSLSNCRTFFPYPNGDSIKYIKGIAIPVVEFHIQGCKIQQTFGWKWRIPWYILKLIDELCSKKAGAHISMFFTSNALMVIEEIKIWGAVLELNNTANPAHWVKWAQLAVLFCCNFKTAFRILILT